MKKTEILETRVEEQMADLSTANEALKVEIAERKQAELRLRDSEKKSRAWREHSPICTKIVDLDFNLQYMSSETLAITVTKVLNSEK